MANVDLDKGEYIHELIGLHASDNITKHTELSAIYPHPTHEGVSESRVFYGPIRFLNHACDTYNVEASISITYQMSLLICPSQFVAVKGGCAWTVTTTRKIAAGEQLYVNYGPGFFEEGCPCNTCSSKPKKDPPKSRVIDVREQRAANKEKRKRKKAKHSHNP